MSTSGRAPVAELIERLRSVGVAVPVGSLLAFLEAVSLLDEDPGSVYWAGRSTLVHDEVGIGVYDAVFRSWLLGEETVAPPTPSLSIVRAAATPDEDGIDDDDRDGASDDERDGTDRDVTPRASAADVLRTRDFGTLDAEERAEVDRLLARLRPTAETRRSRRRRPVRRPARRADDRVDLRRTVREALRTGGEPIRRRSTRRIDAPRRIVLLIDVSGSMESYSRALVRFAHAAVRARVDVEVFTLGTRLTRLTRQLTTTDPDAALTRAAAAVPDWSGGTRLGESLQRFNDEWGTKGMARGAVVVVLSDGWDRGEPADLSREMARLSRVAHRIVWVNPLRSSPGYEPLARGMVAALPYVDDFVDGSSLEAVEELAEVLARPVPVRSPSARGHSTRPEGTP